MKTIVVVAGLIALLGIVGTPDYVLDVERENESLRAQLFKARARARVAELEAVLAAYRVVKP